MVFLLSGSKARFLYRLFVYRIFFMECHAFFTRELIFPRQQNLMYPEISPLKVNPFIKLYSPARIARAQDGRVYLR